MRQDRIVLTDVRSDPPITLRHYGCDVRSVASAGGPLGGDQTRLDIELTGGATLRFTSVAASVVQPGTHSRVSNADVRLDIDGCLTYAPEPLVVTYGAEHISALTANLSGTATLLLREILVLGREPDAPGTIRSSWSIHLDGRALLVQENAFGALAPDGWDGPAVLAGTRVVGNLLLVDPGQKSRSLGWRPPDIADCTVMTLAGPGLLVTSLGHSVAAVRTALDIATLALMVSGVQW